MLPDESGRSGGVDFCDPEVRCPALGEVRDNGELRQRRIDRRGKGLAKRGSARQTSGVFAGREQQRLPGNFVSERRQPVVLSELRRLLRLLERSQGAGVAVRRTRPEKSDHAGHLSFRNRPIKFLALRRQSRGYGLLLSATMGPSRRSASETVDAGSEKGDCAGGGGEAVDGFSTAANCGGSPSLSATLRPSWLRAVTNSPRCWLPHVPLRTGSPGPTSLLPPNDDWYFHGTLEETVFARFSPGDHSVQPIRHADVR